MRSSAKPNGNLDILLGYAIDFWIVVISAAVFALSFAVRAFFLSRPHDPMAMPSSRWFK